MSEVSLHYSDLEATCTVELSDSCDILIIVIVSNNHDNDSMQSYYLDISKHFSQT